jgi:hypothetical protein
VDDASDLIRAIGSLWPLLLVVAVLVFREEVRGVFHRLRRGKLPGVEFELDPELDRLEKSAETAEVAADAGRRALVTQPLTGGFVRPLRSEAWTTRSSLTTAEPSAATWTILGEAANSPKVALMALSAQIEKKAREVLASSQDPRNWEGRPLSHTLQRLDLSPTVRDAVARFRDVRNRIVHGHAASDDDALRAIDSGLKILDAIESLPREIHVVVHPGVEVFADSEGKVRRDDVHGVMLETTSPSGENRRQVFATTRTHFKAGKAVAWEWDVSRVWPESWYRDPEDGKMKYAWRSGGEFIGRHLEDV